MTGLRSLSSRSIDSSTLCLCQKDNDEMTSLCSVVSLQPTRSWVKDSRYWVLDHLLSHSRVILVAAFKSWTSGSECSSFRPRREVGRAIRVRIGNDLWFRSAWLMVRWLRTGSKSFLCKRRAGHFLVALSKTLETADRKRLKRKGSKRPQDPHYLLDSFGLLDEDTHDPQGPEPVVRHPEPPSQVNRKQHQ